MNNELKRQFDILAMKAGIKYDKKLYKKLKKFLDKYQTQGEKVEFFGGVLLGTVKVYFTSNDRLKLFNTIGMDLIKVTNAIAEVKCINNEYKRESDSTNHLLLYTAHRFFTNPQLNVRDRIKYASKVMEIYSSRQYSIIISDQFTFRTPEAIARQVFEELSNKFILRKLGSWKKVMEYRGKQFVNAEARLPVLQDYTCNGVKDAISAVRGDVASTIKRIYGPIRAAYDANSGITTSTLTVTDGEGKEAIRDVEDVTGIHRNKILRLFDEGSLYNKNNLIIAGSVINTVNTNNLRKFIDILTDKNLRNNKIVFELFREVIADTITFSDSYLREQGINLKQDGLSKAILDLKRLLTSSTNNVKFHDLRNKYQKLLSKLHIKTSTRQRNVTIAALQVYIYLMAVTN